MNHHSDNSRDNALQAAQAIRLTLAEATRNDH